MGNVNMFGADFSMMTGSEPSLTPPSETRSLASSPPRGAWMPAHSELRRQRDRVRRDLKLSTRIQRVHGDSYMASPPAVLGDASGAMHVPIYTTAPSSVPLVAASATSMSSQPFPPTYSPTLQTQSHGGQAFTSPYQQPL